MPTARAGTASSPRWPRSPGVANERYARTDTAVTGQALKIVAAKPDAVLVAGSGTPAALPQKTLGARLPGKYYQTHGVANADFLRVGGADVDDTFPRRPRAGGRAAARQRTWCASRPRPTWRPTRRRARQGPGVDLRRARLGRRPADDGGPPAALKKAKPGTPEFRVELRDAIEQGEGSARRARHLQHVADRPPGPGPARLRGWSRSRTAPGNTSPDRTA